MSNPPNHYQPHTYQPQQFVPQYVPVPQQQQQQQQQSNFTTVAAPQPNVVVLGNFRPANVTHNPTNSNYKADFSAPPQQQQQQQQLFQHSSHNNNINNASAALAATTLPAATRFAVWLTNLASKYGHQMSAETVQKLRDNCFDETNFFLLDKDSLTEMQFPLGIRLTLLKIIDGENAAKSSCNNNNNNNNDNNKTNNKNNNDTHLTDLAHESGRRRQREETSGQQHPSTNAKTKVIATNVSSDRIPIDLSFFDKFPLKRSTFSAIWTDPGRACIFHGPVTNHITATCNSVKDLSREERLFLKKLFPDVKAVANLCNNMDIRFVPFDPKFLAAYTGFETRHPELRGVWQGLHVNCLFHGVNSLHNTGACELYLGLSTEEKKGVRKSYPASNYAPPVEAKAEDVPQKM